MTYHELCERLYLRTHRQVRAVLRQLTDLHLIEVWGGLPRQTCPFQNLLLAENQHHAFLLSPCPKDTGFFFFPVVQIPDLIDAGRCSEADMLLDLWMNTVYQDARVPGSALGPVVCYRADGALPLVSCAVLAKRWGVSKATVHRVLKKFEQLSLVAVHRYPGKRGSVIVMQGYLSTMFSVEDTCPTRQALAAEIARPAQKDTECPVESAAVGTGESTTFHWPADAVSKPDIRLILENLRNALYASGFRCSACPHALYRLSNLSGCQEGVHPYDLDLVCGGGGPAYHFSLKLEPAIRYDGVEVEVI